VVRARCRLDARPETFDQAADAYRRALAADPDFADAHCNLGAIHHQRDQRDAARACYEEALRCDALHVEANLNLAGILEEENRCERRSPTTRRRCARTAAHRRPPRDGAALRKARPAPPRPRTLAPLLAVRAGRSLAEIAKKRVEEAD